MPRERDDLLIDEMVRETEAEIFSETMCLDEPDSAASELDLLAQASRTEAWNGEPIDDGELMNRIAAGDYDDFAGGTSLRREQALEQRVQELEAEIANNQTIIGIDQANNAALAREQWWTEQRHHLEARGVYDRQAQDDILLPMEQQNQQLLQMQQRLAQRDAVSRNRDYQELLDTGGHEAEDAMAAYSRMNPNSPFTHAVNFEIQNAPNRAEKLMELYQRGAFTISDTGQEHPMMAQTRRQMAARRTAQNRHGDALFERDIRSGDESRMGSEDEVFNSIHVSDDDWSGFAHGRR